MHRSVSHSSIACAVLLASCASTSVTRKASVIDYLYPEGASAQPPCDVVLEVPIRVGIAFAPSGEYRMNQGGGVAFAPAGEQRMSEVVFDEKRKHDLLERVAQAFRGAAGVQSVEIIPSIDLRPGGGFENLDQVAAMHGVKLVALLSYEQVQFDEMNTTSLTYWTIVGGYVFKGNRNETRTLIDAAVFDVRSRTLLFRSSGSSSHSGSSTAVKAETELREESSAGFTRATDDLIANLQTALDGFREQAKTGTVHGLGTPAISTVVQAEGGAAGKDGVGALGATEVLAALLLLAACGRRAA